MSRWPLQLIRALWCSTKVPPKSNFPKLQNPKLNTITRPHHNSFAHTLRWAWPQSQLWNGVVVTLSHSLSQCQNRPLFQIIMHCTELCLFWHQWHCHWCGWRKECVHFCTSEAFVGYLVTDHCTLLSWVLVVSPSPSVLPFLNSQNNHVILDCLGYLLFCEPNSMTHEIKAMPPTKTTCVHVYCTSFTPVRSVVQLQSIFTETVPRCVFLVLVHGNTMILYSSQQECP
jgi:hypothetical protein